MRELIIKAAMFAAHCIVFIGTVIGAVWGAGVAPFVLLRFDLPFTQSNLLLAQVFCGLIGLAIGFVLTSFAAAGFFLLRDISKNTAILVDERTREGRQSAGEDWR